MGRPSRKMRQQAALFPAIFDEVVPTDAMVCVIDAWIRMLPLAELCFSKSPPQRLCAPPNDLAHLLAAVPLEPYQCRVLLSRS